MFYVYRTMLFDLRIMYQYYHGVQLTFLHFSWKRSLPKRKHYTVRIILIQFLQQLPALIQIPYRDQMNALKEAHLRNDDGGCY